MEIELEAAGHLRFPGVWLCGCVVIQPHQFLLCTSSEVNTKATWLSSNPRQGNSDFFSSLHFFETPLPNLGLVVYRTHIYPPSFTKVASSLLVLLVFRHIKAASRFVASGSLKPLPESKAANLKLFSLL